MDSFTDYNWKKLLGDDDEEDEELSKDEKAGMKILMDESDWYAQLREYMNKNFDSYKLNSDDFDLFGNALQAFWGIQWYFCDLMDIIQIHHKDFSNHKSIINRKRAVIYNFLFETSLKVSDLPLKTYFASFHPSSKHLPYPDHAYKEVDKTSEKPNIISMTDTETITTPRKGSPGEEEQASEGSVIQQPEMITTLRKGSPGDDEEQGSEGAVVIQHSEMITRKRKRSLVEEDEEGSVGSDAIPHPEMTTKKTKRSPGEEDKEGSEGSDVIQHPEMTTKKTNRSPGEKDKEGSDGSDVMQQPEMITKIRQRSPGEEEVESAVPGGVFVPCCVFVRYHDPYVAGDDESDDEFVDEFDT